VSDPLSSAWSIVQLDEIDSTNEEAKRRAVAGDEGPAWIVARRQTQGRGRRGNEWQSLHGNLFASLLCRPEGSASRCAQLSFAAALAVSDTLAQHAPSAGIRLKWPNDVLAEGRKIAGILLESESRADGTLKWLVVGIGVNLAASPQGTEFPTISLAELGVPPPGPAGAMGHLVTSFAKWYEVWQKDGFAPLREAWLARSVGLGARIRVRLPKEEIQGVFRDIDDNGALVLGLPGSVRTIAAGEVFL
jgi:BirA family transcriptional regulator, biotin operon repressor / biotin---[acetyl-CoA-carboxylase] ligase